MSETNNSLMSETHKSQRRSKREEHDNLPEPRLLAGVGELLEVENGVQGGDKWS